MTHHLDPKDKDRLFLACENLIAVRLQYARMALVFADERTGSKEISDRAQKIQLMIDQAVESMVNYLNTGKDPQKVQGQLDEIMRQAETLLSMVDRFKNRASSNIHPDDWAWLHSLTAE